MLGCGPAAREGRCGRPDRQRCPGHGDPGGCPRARPGWPDRLAGAGQARRPHPAGGDRPGLANVHDSRQQVAYCGQAADVADVWVARRRRVADGRLVDHDVVALVEASRPLAKDLVSRARLGEFS
jgi:hypothetical protein